MWEITKKEQIRERNSLGRMVRKSDRQDTQSEKNSCVHGKEHWEIKLGGTLWSESQASQTSQESRFYSLNNSNLLRKNILNGIKKYVVPKKENSSVSFGDDLIGADLVIGKLEDSFNSTRAKYRMARWRWRQRWWKTKARKDLNKHRDLLNSPSNMSIF